MEPISPSMAIDRLQGAGIISFYISAPLVGISTYFSIIL
jgi:hypothetical protein